MSRSSDQTTAGGGEQQSQPQREVRQTARPTQQQGGLDVRLLAIFFAVGLVFNIGFVMLLFLSAEIAGMLAVIVMMVATSIFTGYLVVQIADTAGLDLVARIEGQ